MTSKQPNQAVGFLERKRPEQHVADQHQHQNRRRDTDAERQRAHQRRQCVAPNITQCPPHILPQQAPPARMPSPLVARPKTTILVIPIAM